MADSTARGFVDEQLVPAIGAEDSGVVEATATSITTNFTDAVIECDLWYHGRGDSDWGRGDSDWIRPPCFPRVGDLP